MELRYPAELPITARRDELLDVLGHHQVVIVAGETGSGKSTQLPKLLLEAGRGVHGLIGHTQPRRVAARTIAERVADELGTTIGGTVGFTVRFNDRVGDDTVIRVMTDGILLAELPRDRMLARYDALIIDEAHERSLNIDFILGYLRQLLPRRPDLQVVVTSATIDTERFAHHFARDGVDAPIVEITGRTYPVEMRYRPRTDDGDQVQAVLDAVGELGREGSGDVLVFLSGEREIRDTADALARLERPGLEVLPLYARLSSAEQHRIFQPHSSRRVVLSTNVAETSVTVPGVRYVVDTGVARISRYSRRLKVQRLPIEPISQASANQRAGRCGRLGPGICIRLYGEDDFLARPPYTEPEIVRTNLASVILQMTAIGLGDVTAFPFVEPPDRAAVRDGYLLLEELGAIEPPEDDGSRRLTAIGRRLARLPIDPRLGRMVIEAERLRCVREVLVIASALSMQDVRERPEEHREAADTLHRRFDVAGSDLLSIVALWDHLREQQRALSSNQFRRLCRSEYLHYLRVREWHDLFSQLRQAAGSLGMSVSGVAAHPDHVHQAVLAGLLSHLGERDDRRREPRRGAVTFHGARGGSFVIAPGSVLTKQPPRWVMAGELVETDRLRARRVAAVQPEWAERLGAHLVKRSYGEPRWDERGGRAVVTETVTLYGLAIVAGRTVGLDRVDPALAREMFVRHALVDGEWDAPHAFLRHNEQFRRDVAALEDRARRGGLLDDDQVHDFYDDRVPDDVVSTRQFDRWWRDARGADPTQLDLTAAVLRTTDGVAISFSDFPDTWTVSDDLSLPLRYRFEPGQPLDGVTVTIPLLALNQVPDDGFDWHVPGFRRELAAALARTLPKELRRALIPATDTVAAAFERLGPPHGRFVDALAAALSAEAGVAIGADDFAPEALAGHLRPHLVVVDESGAVLDAGGDIAAIRQRLATATRQAIAGAVPLRERRGLVTWDVGTLPPVVTTTYAGVPVRGYPALLDDDDSVSLRILTNADLQRRVMRGGVRRLLLLAGAVPTGASRVQLSNDDQLALAAASTTVGALATECAAIAIDEVLDEHDLPWDADAFAALRRVVAEQAGAKASRCSAHRGRRARGGAAGALDARPPGRPGRAGVGDRRHRPARPPDRPGVRAAHRRRPTRRRRALRARHRAPSRAAPRRHPPRRPAHGRGAPVGGTLPRGAGPSPPPPTRARRRALAARGTAHEHLRPVPRRQRPRQPAPHRPDPRRPLTPPTPQSGHSASQSSIWSP